VYGEDAKEVSSANPALVEFFIEFKWSHEDDPFYVPGARQSARPPEASSDEVLTMPLNKSSSAYSTLGQIGTYIALQMDSQYRTHAFFVLIVGDYARLMRWDRGGVIFTDRINYNKQSELVEFFERYNAAPPEVRGSDGSVEQPSPEEREGALHHGLGTSDGPLLAVSFADSTRRYIIPSPVARPSLPIGRSTRIYNAYDTQEQRLVIMKDSWPVFVHDDLMEGRVYQQLRGHVRNTPTCVDFSNRGHYTHTQRFIRESWRHNNLAFSLPLRRHHRLILDTVGKPLENFASSKELVRAVRAAMTGMSLKRFASASR
jgi:Fungal protein kinase